MSAAFYARLPHPSRFSKGGDVDPSHRNRAFTNFRTTLLVTSLRTAIRAILLGMGLDQAFIDFFVRAACGIAAALLVILVAGIGIPRRSAVRIHRTNR